MTLVRISRFTYVDVKAVEMTPKTKKPVLILHLQFSRLKVHGLFE